MRILHYIQDYNSDVGFTEDYMSALADGMRNSANFQYAHSFSEFKQKVNAERPDIVHIHNCWSLNTWRTERWCRKHRLPVVLSPHNQLAPWHIRKKYLTKRLPLFLMFLKGIIKRVEAIHAATEQEKTHLLELNVYPGLKNKMSWNRRICVIRNSHRSCNTTDRQMADGMYRLYRKVIDSNPFLAMNDNEKKAENALLRIGLSQDETSAGIPDETVRTIKALGDEAWRKIMLHAQEEGILHEIMKGTAAMQLNVRDDVITNIERFESKYKKNTARLQSDMPRKKALRLEEIRGEEKASRNEIMICTMILNLMFEMRHGTLSKRHIADMYATFRFTDYNEDITVSMLKRIGMAKFAGRILKIMEESLSLEEGFSPMKTISDKGTANIKKKLLNANIQ